MEFGPPPSPNRAEYPFEATLDYAGFVIYVENLPGSVRRGVDPDGHPWSVTMRAAYGEFADTVAVDGDPLDVYVGFDPQATMAYVVHQKVPGTDRWDEDKVILGVRSAEEARALYLAHFDKPGFYGGMTTWPLGKLRRYLDARRKIPQLGKGAKTMAKATPLVFTDGFGMPARLVLRLAKADQLGMFGRAPERVEYDAPPAPKPDPNAREARAKLRAYMNREEPPKKPKPPAPKAAPRSPVGGGPPSKLPGSTAQQRVAIRAHVRHGKVVGPYQAQRAKAQPHPSSATSAPTQEAVAQWALQSYPQGGDAAFLVHGTSPASGGFAREFMEQLRSHFVARPFVRALAAAISARRQEGGIISVASQQEAQRVYSEHAEDFLRAMYVAHGNGQQVFGKPSAVQTWLKARAATHEERHGRYIAAPDPQDPKRWGIFVDDEGIESMPRRSIGQFGTKEHVVELAKDRARRDNMRAAEIEKGGPLPHLAEVSKTLARMQRLESIHPQPKDLPSVRVHHLGGELSRHNFVHKYEVSAGTVSGRERYVKSWAKALGAANKARNKHDAEARQALDGMDRLVRAGVWQASQGDPAEIHKALSWIHADAYYPERDAEQIVSKREEREIQEYIDSENKHRAWVEKNG